MDPAALMRQAQAMGGGGQQGAPGMNPLHQQQNYGGTPRTPQQSQQYGNMNAYQQQPGGTPSYPPQQQQTPSAMDPQQQRFNLSNVNLQGLTPEKFHALPPQQQQMLRMALQQKQQQQQALGMGYPSSSMAGGAGGVPSPAMNGSPSPMGGAGSPVGGGGGGAPGAYPYSGARPPSQGHPPSTPQGGQQHGQQQGQQPQQGAQAASFLKTLTDFYAKRGQPFPGVPSIEGRSVDLSTLYQRESHLIDSQRIYR
jgi:hypothetical protein